MTPRWLRGAFLVSEYQGKDFPSGLLLKLAKTAPLTSHVALLPARDLCLAGTNAHCSCITTGLNYFVKGT